MAKRKEVRRERGDGCVQMALEMDVTLENHVLSYCAYSSQQLYTMMD